MILYHGSNIEIMEIDLGKCRPFKDFGKGFYTTPVKEQALAMAKRTVKIYKEGTPCITEYSFDVTRLEDPQFNIKRFFNPDINWARFVINNRNHDFKDIGRPECNSDSKYDIVSGPVANDDISALVNVYLAGLLPDEALVKQLTYRDLCNQFSFHTIRAVSCLQKSGVYRG